MPCTTLLLFGLSNKVTTDPQDLLDLLAHQVIQVKVPLGLLDHKDPLESQDLTVSKRSKCVLQNTSRHVPEGKVIIVQYGNNNVE